MNFAEKLTKLVKYRREAKELNQKLEDCLYGKSVGGKSWYDEFWDNLQRNGIRLHYSNAFAYAGWNDTIFNPKYPIVVKHVEGIGSMFRWNMEITNTKVPISVTNGSVSNAFSNAQLLKTIPSLEVNGVTNFSNAFQSCTALEELNLSGVIDINGFDIHWSTKLSADSLKSIIQALSTTTTGLTITLPTTAQANYEAVYGSGSWNVLTATRSNWTIAYA